MVTKVTGRKANTRKIHGPSTIPACPIGCAATSNGKEFLNSLSPRASIRDAGLPIPLHRQISEFPAATSLGPPESSLASSARQCIRHAPQRGRFEPMQVNRLKSRARVRRTLYLHHAPECVHTIHAGKHRATADPEVRARLRTAHHTALGYHRAHVFRVAREERARHHLSPARMAPEPESELLLSNSSPTGRARSSLAGRSACPVEHFNSEVPKIPPARTCLRRSPGGCTSRAPSPSSSRHCVEANSADALQPPLARKHLHGVQPPGKTPYGDRKKCPLSSI